MEFRTVSNPVMNASQADDALQFLACYDYIVIQFARRDNMGIVSRHVRSRLGVPDHISKKGNGVLYRYDDRHIEFMPVMFPSMREDLEGHENLFYVEFDDDPKDSVDLVHVSMKYAPITYAVSVGIVSLSDLYWYLKRLPLAVDDLVLSVFLECGVI